MFETVFEKASDSLLDVLRAALDECIRLDNRWVCSEHILLAMIRENDNIAGAALASMKISADSVQKEADERLRDKTESEPMFSERADNPEAEASDKPKLRVFSRDDASSIGFSQMVVEALKRSNDYSLFFGATEIHPEHLLLGVIDIKDAGVNDILEELAVNVTFLRRQVFALSARASYAKDNVPGLRLALINGFDELVNRYQANAHALTNLAARAGGVHINIPSRGQIVHMICMAFMGEFLSTQVAFQRYLLEENIRALGHRAGSLDKELTASIVSSGAQNLRSDVRTTIEHIWCNQYRLLTRLLDDGEHDLIGSVIEDLWWAQSEEIALNDLFSEALDDHRRKQVLSLQKRRLEIAARLTKLRHRLEETVRQCFVKHSISA
ncbi:MAG TPA: Clp protease N-terminal domain-containing protein [Trichormus sp.]|jgi:hypothetical protein